ncbi:acyltransferase family protein [Clostridium sp. YIM B02505]|uniref:Acyltransferase family protein n=1 Tax=Clostridium yunnanense TaxID=2800325 RepID=A0ABS1EQI6_9CLOT|nr:acyltransferase family protein [Clostridium yunnanense]MBK1811617.1 acyltransferase family protein [Clostridium yunnanense]
MRKHYIDWLRNICILFLFPFHTARIFDGNEPNYVQGTPHLFTTNLVFLSFWFMPLMFLLAGMSSKFSLCSRTNKQYIKERFLRLFVPLFVGILILMPPQGYIAVKFHYGYNYSFFDYLKKFFSDFSDLSGYFGSFTPGPLWFIIFLFIISIVTLPLMRGISKSYKVKSHLIKLFSNPLKITTVGLAITIISILPSIGGKNIFVYGLIFIAGFILTLEEKICEMIEKYRLYYLIITIIGSITMLIEIYTIGHIDEFSTLGIIFSLMYYFTIWISLLAWIGYGKRYLNFNAGFLSYFSKAAFPIYIMHQTYLIIIGYFILRTVNIFSLQYISIILLTFIICLISYEIIRRFRLTRFLFGIK